MYALKRVQKGAYDSQGYSNENTIASLMLEKPEEINNILTYTYGMDDDRFPLTFLTEGQGQAGIKDIATVKWNWKTMGRMKFNDSVLYFNTSNTTPGRGGAMFEVEFSNHLIIEQYGLIAPDGVTQVRVMKDLGKGPHGGFLYRLKLTNPNPNIYVASENLSVGKFWSMTSPTVSESYSKGNRSNVMGPGKMTSQLEFHRYSKEIGGNISNTVVSYQFKTGNGGTTDLWINEEMRQHQLNIRVMDEERLWIAEYNANENGEVTLLDEDTQSPIPHTAGMMQICDEANYDTYGEYLPLSKIKRFFGDILSNDTQTSNSEIVLFSGRGFMDDFDMALKTDAADNGFTTPLGDKMIDTVTDGLSYGKYFRQYKTIDGHVITVKHLPFCDHGTLAENAKSNGMIHPRTGLPITSHQAFLVDMSEYDGIRNVRKVRQKGQVYISGVIKGMAPIPPSWGAVPTNSMATDVDASRHEIKNSFGLQVNNSSRMGHIKCVL